MEIQGKFNTSKYIKYGDMVTISDINKKTIVYSDGFIRLNVQVSNLSQQVIINDIHGCVFRIVPNYSFDFYEKQENLIKFINEENLVKSEKLYNILLNQVQEEIRVNLDQCNDLMGSTISQGKFLQFQHFKSKKYLTLEPLESIPHYKESYALKLRDKPSHNSIFKIVPCYVYQKEFSTVIKYEEDVYIICEQHFKSKNLFLAVSDKLKSQQIYKQMGLGLQLLKNSFMTKQTASKQLEGIKSEKDLSQVSDDFFYNSDILFANFLEKSKLRISCFNNDFDDQQIFMNDCVWIIHIECFSALIYNSEQESAESIYFEQFHSKIHKNTMGLWKIEGKNLKSGAKLQCTEMVRFKNLQSNKYMSILNEKKIVLDDEGGDNSWFEIIPYRNFDEEIYLQNYVSSSKVFFIKHNKSQLYLSKQSTNKEERLNGFSLKPFISKDPAQDDYFKFIKAGDSELIETLFLKSCQPPLIKGLNFLSNNNSSQYFIDVKQLNQSDEHLFKEMKQCLTLLKDFCSLDFQNTEQQQEEQLGYKQKILIEQGYFRILFMIIKYCFPDKQTIHQFLDLINQREEQSVSNISDPVLKISLKQTKMLRNLQKFSNISNDQFTHLKNQYVKEFILICDLCYQLIQKMCYKNYFNQIICFKYIELIKEQVGYIYGATKCIMTTIVNNEQLLNLVHSNNVQREYKSILHQIVKQKNSSINEGEDKAEFRQLKRFKTLDEKAVEHQGKNHTLIHNIYASYKESLELLYFKHKHLTEFIDFMNCLCNFKEEGISINQIVIKNLLIHDTQIFVPIRQNSSDQLEIGRLVNKEFVFQDFINYFDTPFFTAEQKEDEIIYLQTQLALFSNLCKGRNYINIKYFRQIFTSKSLISCICDENISFVIRASFTDLLHSIHIDSKPRSERVIPMLTRVAHKPDVEGEVKKKFGYDILNILMKSAKKLKQIVKINDTFDKIKKENQQSLLDLSSDKKQPFKMASIVRQKTKQIQKQQTILMGHEDLEDFLLEEDSLSEFDIDTLKKKLIQYFENDIYVSKMENNQKSKEVTFDRISLNMIILVRKLIKYNFFDLNPIKNINSRLEMMQNVIDNKYQNENALRKYSNQNPFHKIINALLQILKVDIENKLGVEINSQLIVSQTLQGFHNNQKKTHKNEQIPRQIPIKNQKNHDFAKEIKSMVTDDMKLFLHNTKKINESQDMESSQIENSIKMELVRNLIYYGELKHDYYIENMLEFIKISSKLCEKQLDDVVFMEKHFEESLDKYMPIVMFNGIGDFVKNDQDQHDLNNIMGQSVLPLFMQYFYNSSNQLFTFLMLKLITSKYIQRANLIKDLKHLQIIQEPAELNIFIEARTKAIQLNFDAEQSEIWLQNLHDGKESEQILVHRIIDNLQYMVDISHDLNNISINRQIMLRNIKIHEIVIKLLKDSNQKMKHYNKYQKNNQSDTLISEVFKNCYKFLQVFIKNNNRLNIKLLNNDYEMLFMQLSYAELGQSQFFNILYHNNYDSLISLDPNLIHKFVEKIINFGHSPEILNFMEIVMYYRGNPYYPNWDKVLDIILDHKALIQLLMIKKNSKYLNETTIEQKKETSLFSLVKDFARVDNDEEDNLAMSQALGQYLFDFDESNISKSVPYIYHYLFLRLFNKLIEQSVEKQQIAQSLISKILDVNYLFYLVGKRDIFDINFSKDSSVYILNSLMKQECLRILNIIHLKTPNCIKQLYKNTFLITFLKQENENLVRFSDQATITNMIEIFQSTRQQYTERENYQSINNEILSRYKTYIDDLSCDFIEYVFIYVLPIITSLYKNMVLNKKQHVDDQRADITSINNYINQFEIFCNKLQIDYGTLRSCKSYKNIVKNFQEYQIIQGCDLNIINIDKQKEEKEQYVQQTTIDEMVDLPLQDIMTQRNMHLDNTNEVKWRSLVLSMLTSECIKVKYIEVEKNALIDAILGIEKFSHLNLQLSLPGFLKKLFKFVQDTIFQRYDVKGLLKSEIKDMDNLAEVIIQLIINIVKRDNELQKNGKKMQDIFMSNGLITIIAQILSRKKTSSKVFYMMIDLSNVILVGAKKTLQDQYLHYFQSSNNGEQLFTKLHKQIMEEIGRIQSYQVFPLRVKKISKKINFSYKPLKEHRTLKVLKYLQLLCEGHNINFQIYIRKQNNSPASINHDLLQYMVQLIYMYFNNLNQDNYDKITQTFDTIIEMTQGPCEENQKALSEGKLLESLTYILQQKEETFCRQNQDTTVNMDRKRRQSISMDMEQNFIQYIQNISPNFAASCTEYLICNGKQNKQWMISRLKYKSLLALEALLEGNSNFSILRKVQQQIPLSLIKNNIHQIFQNFKILYKDSYTEDTLNHLQLDPNETPEGKNPKVYMRELTFIIQNGFQFYNLYKKYQEMYSEDNSFEQEQDQIEEQIKQTKESTSLSNALDFFENKPEVVTFSESLKFFEEKTGYVELQKDSKIFHQYFTLLPFCLCLTQKDIDTFNSKIIRLSTKTKLSSLQNVVNETIYSMKYEYKLTQRFKSIKILYLLFINIDNFQFISFIFSVLENIFILIDTENDHGFQLIPLIIKQRGEERSISYLYVIVVCQIIVMSLNTLVFLFYSLKIVPIINQQYQDEIKNLYYQNPDQKPLVFLQKLQFLMDTLEKNPIFVYKIFYTTMVYLGYFNELFIAFQLIDIFFQLPMLLTVIRAVWRPKMQLFITIIWMLIVQFYFTLILYYFFSEEFVFEEVDVCSELISCFSMVVDVTLKSDGGFTGFNMIKKEEYHSWTFSGYAGYAFVYNFIINILTLNILTGIIIDTFAILRKEEEYTKNDIDNVCFICGEQRSTLDKRDLKKGFDYHIQYVHRIWDYVYFIATLQEKDKNDMSGIESYVYDNYKNNNIDWFPAIDVTEK